MKHHHIHAYSKKTCKEIPKIQKTTTHAIHLGTQDAHLQIIKCTAAAKQMDIFFPSTIVLKALVNFLQIQQKSLDIIFPTLVLGRVFQHGLQQSTKIADFPASHVAAEDCMIL